jgi:hypothetical protein
MRLSVSVSFLAMLVGIASACKSGEYSCGSGGKFAFLEMSILNTMAND